MYLAVGTQYKKILFFSIQCKEEKITETKNIEGESKFSNKNENVESEKSTLADTQCATNTSPNISSQEIMNEDARNKNDDVIATNLKIDNHEQKNDDNHDDEQIKTNKNVTEETNLDRQIGDLATTGARSPVENNDGDVESDDLDEEEDEDDDEKMDPYTFSDDEKDTISPPNSTIPGIEIF